MNPFKTMKTMMMLGILMLMVTMAGCETFKGWFGGDTSKIEAVLAAQVAGEYVVEFKKDGAVLHSEKWVCTRGDDGKLSGCHRQ